MLESVIFHRNIVVSPHLCTCAHRPRRRTSAFRDRCLRGTRPCFTRVGRVTSLSCLQVVKIQEDRVGKGAGEHSLPLGSLSHTILGEFVQLQNSNKNMRIRCNSIDGSVLLKVRSGRHGERGHKSGLTEQRRRCSERGNRLGEDQRESPRARREGTSYLIHVLMFTY